MTENLTYKSSGVDTQKADGFVEFIKHGTKNHQTENVISGVGGFAALFSLENFKYKKPVIVSSTDGVGTKILVANEAKQHDSIGIDLVAMCVNDILCHGALPLFFLDYYAMGNLEVEVAQKVLNGVMRGCQIAKIPLVGGETAEMPGLYQKNDYDLAGFAVGIVEKDDILPKDIKNTDKLIALSSSGFHSNGFSLIRKVFQTLKIKYSDISPWGGKTWAEVLLEPTKIYVDQIWGIKHILKGAAHITGGGIIQNLERIVPQGIKINLDYQNWPELFVLIMEEGKIKKDEMLKTFNCGLGMIAVLDSNHVTEALTLLGGEAFCVGSLSE